VCTSISWEAFQNHHHLVDTVEGLNGTIRVFHDSIR
jgi:hypothetical protein